jgi:hypothetical protein
MLDIEKFGYVLWEGIILPIVIFGGIGLLVLRRKSRGKPAFTNQDYELFFGASKIKMSKPKEVLTLGLAVILCLIIGGLEFIVLAPLGATLLTSALVLTSLAIVYKLFF